DKIMKKFEQYIDEVLKKSIDFSEIANKVIEEYLKQMSNVLTAEEIETPMPAYITFSDSPLEDCLCG
ncbi:7665_t:CDS:2, partial [Paraglomus brasilianum]